MIYALGPLLAPCLSRREAHTMTDTRPGPDAHERSLQAWLRKRVDGPAPAEKRPLPSVPAHLPTGYEPLPHPEDWFTRLYGPDGASPIETAADQETDPDDADDEQQATPRRRTRTRRESARQALAEATPNLPSRLRWLALHATAAAAGYPLGLVTWGTDTASWFAAGHWTDNSAWALYFLAAAALALYRRTRQSLLLVAWSGAMPVSSVALGVLLYGAN